MEIVREQAGAMDRLWEDWLGRVLAYAGAGCDGGEAAERCAVAAFAEASRRLEEADPAHPAPWLFGIVHGHVEGRARPDASRHRPPAVGGPLERMTDADVIGLLDGLPRRHRQAILLRHMAGLEPAEVAGVLEISPAEAAALERAATDSLLAAPALRPPRPPVRA